MDVGVNASCHEDSTLEILAHSIRIFFPETVIEPVQSHFSVGDKAIVAFSP